jgi:histidinol dehydrogenase
VRIERRSWDGAAPRSLAAELRAFAPAPAAIAADVARIVASVRAGGNRRVIELGEQFDGVRVDSLVVDPALSAAARDGLDADLRAGLELAAANVRAVAEAQLGSTSSSIRLPQGQVVKLGEVPVGAAGIYVPGGRAPYPSTALMGVIAARVAGVGRVVVASPPGPDGAPAVEVLAASAIAGADQIYAIGGAQAIAALAVGTETIAPVDVIAGPGGPWVQEAKLAVARECGIDGYAGPSELVLISDGSVSARWLALDLCAQAEHGVDGLLVAIATEARALDELEAALGDCSEHPTVSDAPLALVEAPGADAALELSEAIAPEHLQLSCAGAGELAARVRTAGCVFVGPEGATAFGDYAAGSNHVLPTGGAGRFNGPLGPGSFRRRISTVEMTPGAAVELAPVVDTIARAEGFEVHGSSALARAEAGTARAAPADKE